MNYFIIFYRLIILASIVVFIVGFALDFGSTEYFTRFNLGVESNPSWCWAIQHGVFEITSLGYVSFATLPFVLEERLIRKRQNHLEEYYGLLAMVSLILMTIGQTHLFAGIENIQYIMRVLET